MSSGAEATVQIAGDIPTRSFAAAVDLLVVSLVIFLLAIPIGILLGPAVRVDPTADRTADLLQIDRTVATVDAVVALIVSGGYFIGSWRRAGRTLGMRWFGLRVHDRRGATLGVAGSASRWAVTWAPLSLVGLVNAVGAPAGILWLLTALVALWLAAALVLTSRARDRRGPHDRIAGSVVTKTAHILTVPGVVVGGSDVG